MRYESNDMAILCQIDADHSYSSATCNTVMNDPAIFSYNTINTVKILYSIMGD